MNTRKCYTGIGSRSTPPKILELMTRLAVKLESMGYTLRSGGADGADKAFEDGALHKEIYLPWKEFNDSQSTNYSISAEAFNLASTIHPAWSRCSQAAKKLHARNTYQVLGKDLDKASHFVICYTDKGITKGGTATAINLALQYGIEVINLGKPESVERMETFLKE